jgi:hypothetical protein
VCIHTFQVWDTERKIWRSASCVWLSVKV